MAAITANRRLGEAVTSVPGNSASPSQATAPQGSGTLSAQPYTTQVQAVDGTGLASGVGMVRPAGVSAAISVNAAQVSVTVGWAPTTGGLVVQYT